MSLHTIGSNSNNDIIQYNPNTNQIQYNPKSKTDSLVKYIKPYTLRINCKCATCHEEFTGER